MITLYSNVLQILDCLRVLHKVLSFAPLFKWIMALCSAFCTLSTPSARCLFYGECFTQMNIVSETGQNEHPSASQISKNEASSEFSEQCVIPTQQLAISTGNCSQVSGASINLWTSNAMERGHHSIIQTLNHTA